jgi:drug/metabolite transporter (DMT)-like permease
LTDPRRPPSSLALGGAFFVTAAIWGSTFLVISIGNDTMPPFWAAAIRLALAAPLLFLIAAVARQPLPRGPALTSAALFGLLSFGIGFTLLYWAERHAPSGLAAVIYATIPLTSTLLTRAFGLESLTGLKVGAALVALIGVAVIFRGQTGGTFSVAALMALLVASVAAALGTVLLKRGPRQSPIGANAVGAVAGFAVCLAASLLAREPLVMPSTWAQLFPILYLTVAGSIGAFVLMAWLVNHWDVTRISFVSVIVPVVALILGAVVRHERLAPTSLLGSALVIVGVLLRVAADRRRAAR